MLVNQVEIPVRFNEADPLGIVWHGHYVRYFEDGREAFGKQFGLAYLDFFEHGIVVPIVSMHCDFKKPLRYGDTMKLVTTFESSPAAKLLFKYQIYHSKSNDLVASGSSVQVFVDAKSFELHLTIPSFFEQWKNRWNVI